MWHVDTTVLRLLDGTRVSLPGVIDNFSRRILAWSLTSQLEPLANAPLLVKAMESKTVSAPGTGPQSLMVDGGVENFNRAVDDLSQCPRMHPGQLTPDEVGQMRHMVTVPEYRHVPTSTLAILAQRLGGEKSSPRPARGVDTSATVAGVAPNVGFIRDHRLLESAPPPPMACGMWIPPSFACWTGLVSISVRSSTTSAAAFSPGL